MRTTFSGLSREMSAGIETASRRLASYQRQVSSGKRVVTPSDDPSAAARAVTAYGEQSAIERYAQTAATTAGRLTVVDSTLSGIIDTLSRAQVAAMSTAGSTALPSQREAAARELTGLRDALFEDLNLSYQGIRIFGGSASSAAPFTKDASGVVSAYGGNDTELTVDIDRSRPVTVTYDGSRLTEGGDAEDVFAVFETAIAAAGSGDSAGLAEALAGLARAFERATALQGEVGNALRTIEVEEERQQVRRETNSASIANLEEADMVRAITGMNEADTSYRAALGAAASALRVSLLDYLR